MAYYGSLEQLAVRGEAGISYNEEAAENALDGNSYDTALIRLTTRVDSCLLLLRRHVQLKSFTIDVIADEGKVENEDGNGGVLGFISNLVGGKKDGTATEDLIGNAFTACSDQGFNGIHVLAKLTRDSMPGNASRDKYNPGNYGEALMNGFRAYYMFQRPNELFDVDGVGLWGGTGGGCVQPVTMCYLVLVFKIEERAERNVRLPPLGTTQCLPTTTTTPRKGRKRPIVAENTEENCSPIQPRKRGRTAKTTTQPKQIEEEEDQENAEERMEIEEEKRIPNVWYSPDITLPNLPPSPLPPQQERAANTKSPPAKPTNPVTTPKKPTNQTPERPKRAANQGKASPRRTTIPEPVRKVEEEKEEEEEDDVIFGFEKPTPRGKGARRTTTITPGRKSGIFPQWSDEDREEVLRFFDMLNQKETEQTRIALTCKFASIRFGQDLPSKQLYQMISKKGTSPGCSKAQTQLSTLPGGEGGELQAARELFLSLGSEATESKRVAFTCRFMKVQYGVDISSKELFGALKDGGKKKGRK